MRKQPSIRELVVGSSLFPSLLPFKMTYTHEMHYSLPLLKMTNLFLASIWFPFQELALLFEELDDDGDGQVSFDEFLHGLFVAKDIQQSDIEPEWEQKQQSTPYNQTPAEDFTTKVRNYSVHRNFLEWRCRIAFLCCFFMWMENSSKLSQVDWGEFFSLQGQRRSLNNDDSFFLSRTGGSSSTFGKAFQSHRGVLGMQSGLPAWSICVYSVHVFHLQGFLLELFPVNSFEPYNHYSSQASIKTTSPLWPLFADPQKRPIQFPAWQWLLKHYPKNQNDFLALTS